jgi:hypothetical protein
MTFCEQDAPASQGTTYRQCQLQKGSRSQVSWIPARLAVCGWMLKLRMGAEWEDGWRVTAVYAHEYVDLHRTLRRFADRLK